MALNRKLLWIAVALCLMDLIFAALINRPMLNDGSFWYFYIFHTRSPFRDITYVRLADTLLQWPAVLVLRFFDKSAFDVTPYVSGILSFAYSLHPLVSLAACALILRAKGRLELLAFPVLSLAVATLPTLAFASGEAPDMMSLLWPLFFLVALRTDPPSKPCPLNLFFTLLLSFAFAVSYEPACVGFALLFGISLWRFKDSKYQDWVELAFAFLFLIGMTWLIWRIVGPTAGRKTYFLQSLRATPQTLRLFGWIIVLGSIPALLAAYFRGGSRKLNLLMLIILGLATFWMAYVSFINPWWHTQNVLGQVYDSRTTSVPMAVLIAGFCYLISRRGKEFTSPFLNQYFTGVVAVSLLVAVTYDVRVSLLWQEGKEALHDYLNKHPGCSVISNKEYMQKFLPYGIASWDLPHASVAMMNHRKSGSLVFAEQPDGKPVPDYCGSFKKGVTGPEDLDIATASDFPIPISGPNIYWDLSALNKAGR